MDAKPIEKVIEEWSEGNLTTEEAITEILWHIQNLYQSQNAVASKQWELSDKVKELIQKLATLQASYQELQKEHAISLTNIAELK